MLHPGLSGGIDGAAKIIRLARVDTGIDSTGDWRVDGQVQGNDTVASLGGEEGVFSRIITRCVSNAVKAKALALADAYRAHTCFDRCYSYGMCGGIARTAISGRANGIDDRACYSAGGAQGLRYISAIPGRGPGHPGLHGSPGIGSTA